MAIILLTIALPLTFLPSCNGDKNDSIEVFFDPQTTATFLRTNVNTLISDSGRTQSRMTTPKWLMFQKASEPYWYFPEGVYLEQFDSLFNVESSFKADNAYFYERRNLWEANGNVDMTNLKGERFRTSQIFWDRQNKTIYSDSFVHISRGDMNRAGIGFRSNDNLTSWAFYDASGLFPFETQRKTNVSDSIPLTDSVTLE